MVGCSNDAAGVVSAFLFARLLLRDAPLRRFPFLLLSPSSDADDVDDSDEDAEEEDDEGDEEEKRKKEKMVMMTEEIGSKPDLQHDVVAAYAVTLFALILTDERKTVM